MKKVLSAVVAGALLLNVSGVVLASSGVHQSSDVSSVTTSSSSTGGNSQSGKGTLLIVTGNSDSSALSLTAGNVNVGKSRGKVSQHTDVTSTTVSTSSTGGNVQTGSTGHHRSGSQSIGTGDSSSQAGSATVGNVSFSFGH